MDERGGAGGRRQGPFCSVISRTNFDQKVGGASDRLRFLAISKQSLNEGKWPEEGKWESEGVRSKRAKGREGEEKTNWLHASHQNVWALDTQKSVSVNKLNGKSSQFELDEKDKE
jgi:hypothetical protein